MGRHMLLRPVGKMVVVLVGPTGGKLRYPAISSKALPHTTLDAGVKHWEFFRLCLEPALFAFIRGCEPLKSGKKARECQCRMVKRKLAMSLLPSVARSLLWVLIQERTRAGLLAARARGKIGGRRPVRPDNPRVQMAYALYTAQRLTAAEICQALRISPATFYRYVAIGRRTTEGM